MSGCGAKVALSADGCHVPTETIQDHMGHLILLLAVMIAKSGHSGVKAGIWDVSWPEPVMSSCVPPGRDAGETPFDAVLGLTSSSLTNPA